MWRELNRAVLWLISALEYLPNVSILGALECVFMFEDENTFLSLLWPEVSDAHPRK